MYGVPAGPMRVEFPTGEGLPSTLLDVFLIDQSAETFA